MLESFEYFAGQSAVAIGRARVRRVSKDRLPGAWCIGEGAAQWDLGMEHAVAILATQAVAYLNGILRGAVHAGDEDSEKAITHAEAGAHGFERREETDQSFYREKLRGDRRDDRVGGDEGIDSNQ